MNNTNFNLEYIKACHHTPSCKLHPISRFLDFLFQMNKLYDSEYGTAQCSNCRATIQVPQSFYSPLIRLIYMLSSMGIGVLLGIIADAFHPIFRVIVILSTGSIAMYLVDRIVKAMFFAFCDWIPLTDERYSIVNAASAVANQRRNRWAARWYGILVSGCVFTIDPIGCVYVVSFIAILLLVSALITRKIKFFWISIVFLIFCGISLVIRQFVTSEAIDIADTCVMVIFLAILFAVTNCS